MDKIMHNLCETKKRLKMVEKCRECKCSESIIRVQYPINSSGILPELFDDTNDDNDGDDDDDYDDGDDDDEGGEY